MIYVYFYESIFQDKSIYIIFIFSNSTTWELFMIYIPKVWLKHYLKWLPLRVRREYLVGWRRRPRLWWRWQRRHIMLGLLLLPPLFIGPTRPILVVYSGIRTPKLRMICYGHLLLRQWHKEKKPGLVDSRWGWFIVLHLLVVIHKATVSHQGGVTCSSCRIIVISISMDAMSSRYALETDWIDLIHATRWNEWKWYVIITKASDTR